MITFDRWLSYCLHVADDGAPGSGFGADQEAVESLTPAQLGAYMPGLLRSLDGALDGDQLARTLWFVFGDASGYARRMLNSEVQQACQIEWLEALGAAYLRVFDRVCCASGSDPDGRYYDREALDIAVYMLWDMSGLADSLDLLDPEVEPELWRVVDAALGCRTSTCIVSALHGLGHLWPHNSDRVARRIDQALVEHTYPDWLREYAARARNGKVQ